MKDTEVQEGSMPSEVVVGDSESERLLGDLPSETAKTRVSPWYIIAPLFFLTIGMGALLAPLVQFYTEIFCDIYYRRHDGEGTSVLRLFVDGEASLPDIQDCAIPDVQMIVSRVQAIVMFLTSGSSLLLASFYGSLSDRRGRRFVFQMFALGGVLQMLCFIGISVYQGELAASLFILAPLVRGFLVGDSVVLAAIQAYISDCTTHEKRTIAFGRMMASIFLGICVGPIIAGVLIKETGSVVSIFYLVLVIMAGFFLYVTFVMPESLDQETMMRARRDSQLLMSNKWQKLNIFAAISVIFTTRPQHMSRWAVPLLATVHFLVAMLMQPPTLLYAMLEFHWTAVEGGYLLSVSAFMRLLIVVIILPYAFAYLKRRHSALAGQTTTRIRVDLFLIRLGMLVEGITFVLAALATSSTGFSIALIFQSIGILSQPSLRSLYTSLVPPSQVGALLGAQAVLDSIALMISQTGLNFIYSVSVKTMPSLILYVCALVAFLACLASCLVHPVDTSATAYSPL
ncbi:major facilitator superfamily domain-containing protein [Gongronella butleri]|nr:major facilitator superfamily domain-containing protein [Gongronella butleri]